MHTSPIDNDTRKETGPLTVYREDRYILPGETPDLDRTVIVRSTSTLDQTLGVGVGLIGQEEFFGVFEALAHDNRTGQIVAKTELRFPLPGPSIHDAFAALLDQEWTGREVKAALGRWHDEQRKAALSQRPPMPGLALPGGIYGR